MVTQAVAGGRF